jgi:AcrR family transcriptional regulator
MVHRVSVSSTVSRREREKQHRRQAILDAAERVFALRGFHGASMDQIAQEAEYAPGTLYLYFKDKNALYSALFISKLAQMVDQVEQAAQAGADPLEGLRNAIRAQFEFNDHNKEFFAVFTRHRPAEQTDHAREWNSVHDTLNRHHEVLTRLIERGQRKKQLRPGNSRAYAVALLGSIIHTSHEMELSGAPLSKEADFVFELFLKGAQRSPSSP